MAGTAPRADVWVAVEHPLGWGDAALARSGHGVRILMARGRRANAADGSVVSAVRVWVGYAAAAPTLRVGRIERPEDVAGWDLSDIAAGSMRDWGRPDPDPLLLVCANGRRDRCCGHEGGRLAEALWRGPHRDRVLTCTHLGGHRFAPTALLLPVGALHGRLDESSATDLIAQAHEGRTPGAQLRGFSTLDEPAQVADAHVRTLTGFDGTLPLRVELATSGNPDRMAATVRGWDTHDAHRSLVVALMRSSSATLMACGRVPEASTRWSPAR